MSTERQWQDCWTGLPGAELVRQGLDDLSQAKRTEAALLLLIARPRLQALGVPITNMECPGSQPVEHELYELIEGKIGPAAHSHYNSLIRRIVSFAHALERETGPGRRNA
jgi:hypothetical protein